MVNVVVDHLIHISVRIEGKWERRGEERREYEHNEVDTKGKGNSQSTIHPKQYYHNMLQPSLFTHHPDPVLTDVHHDDTKAHNRRWNEQTLRRMQERRPKSPWVQVETARYHNDVENEQNHITNEEDTP